MHVEICVDSAAGAVAAERGGADRVELCANLLEGGTTPSAGCIKRARQVKIGLFVMIRARGGDFLYQPDELEVMREDIRVAKDLGADGVVFGCLTADGNINCSQTEQLLKLAKPLQVTCHRAFDMSINPERALEDLVALGVDRVLTSGQESSALEGMALIGALHKQAAGRICVMAGGGITLQNVERLIDSTGITEFHLSARTSVESGMSYRNERVFMGGALQPAEFSWKTTDESTVRSIVQLVHR
jgi:copper homeostasis protein